MALIPVFAKQTREELIENWNVEFSSAEWVSIELPFEVVKKLDEELDTSIYEADDLVEYETNRYDVSLFDPEENKTISLYVYMNEDSDQVLAMDNVVQDQNEKDEHYALEETPFEDVLYALQSLN